MLSQVYFLPSILAAARSVRLGNAVYIVNLWTGWTGIGWVIALVMALALPTNGKPLFLGL